MKTVLLGLALVIVAVSRTAQAQTNAQPLAVRAEPTDSATRLVLVAAPGWKINARVKPALELPSGAIVRFDAPQLTADSAYFAEPPTARILGRVAQRLPYLINSRTQAMVEVDDGFRTPELLLQFLPADDFSRAG